jgi:hypothetical protein
LSTTIGFPNCSEIRVNTTRPSRSVVLPGALGRITRSGRSGYAAAADVTVSAIEQASSQATLCMHFS